MNIELKKLIPGNNLKILYPIGYKFKIKRCEPRKRVIIKEYTVIDYDVRINKDFEFVSLEYKCVHDFLGQKVISNKVQATIDIATNCGYRYL